jgi:hypothetical protein
MVNELSFKCADIGEKLPPDVAELRDAEFCIKRVYVVLEDMRKEIEHLKSLGPSTVLAPTATHYKNLVDLEDAIQAVKAQVFHMKESLRFTVLPGLFEQNSVKSVTTLNGYRIAIDMSDISVSVPPENKGKAYDWLTENGYGDIITSTINSSTLKATVKNMLKENMPVPEDVFKISPYVKLSVTKAP